MNYFFEVKRIDCYDLDLSIYSKHPVDGSYKFSKMVLKTGPLEEYGYQYHIVRSAENNKIVVSEQLKKKNWRMIK